MALITNLVSYWKLDEASGNALDIHGANALTDQNTVGTAAGVINTSRDFIATNTEYFSKTDNTDLSIGDVDFTLAGWFYLNAVGGLWNGLLNKWNIPGSSREYRLYYSSGGLRFGFQVSNDGTAEVTVTANNFGAPSANTWYFIAVWHDSSANQIGISINAGTPDTTAHTTGVFDGTADFELGRDVDVGYLDGRVDELGFWKPRVLSSQDISDLYNGGAGLPYSSFAGASLMGQILT